MPTTTPFPDTEPGKQPQLFHLQAFAGVNRHAKRPAIGDTEFSWLENYFPSGDGGNMRAMRSNGTAIFIAPGNLTIVYKYAYNIGGVGFMAVFLSDGTATQVNLATGATVVISNVPGDFFNGGFLPAATQWTASGIIIVTQAQTNGYFAWDGATLFRPGAASPAWLNGGTPTTMPSGLHGSGVETYQGRVWVITPPPHTVGGISTLLQFSAPGNGADFTGASGGGAVPQQESTLRDTYTALRQANGFLYAFGDSSVTVISNVQTGGTPLATTFSNLNVDPQVGTPWPGTVQVFSGIQQYGAGILFANPQGVFVLLGGTVQKVSDNLDGLFENRDTSFIPTAAVVLMFNTKMYCLLIRSIDYLGVTRNFMCVWDGRKWFIASQVQSLINIVSQELNSQLNAWGDEGKNLVQLFTNPTTQLVKTLQTKLWAGGQQNEAYIFYKKVYRFYIEAQDNSAAGIALSGTIDTEGTTRPLNIGVLLGSFQFTNSSGGIINFTNSSGGIITFGVQAFVISGTDQPGYGRLLGFTLGSTVAAGANTFQFVNSTGGVINFTNSGGGVIVWGVGTSTGGINSDYTLIALTLPFTLDAPFLG